MTESMNSKDYNDASLALAQWFISQNINPSEASIVMMKTLARQLVRVTTELPLLYEDMHIHTELMLNEVLAALGSSR